MIEFRKHYATVELKGEIVDVENKKSKKPQLVGEEFILQVRKDLNSVGAPPNEVDLVILIDSVGGSARAMNNIVGMLQSLKYLGYRIVTVNTRKAASAAAIIFSMGDVRILNPASEIMIHHLIYDAMCSMLVHKKLVKVMEKESMSYIDLVAKNFGISKRKIRKECSKGDWRLNALEACQLGMGEIMMF